MFKIGEYLAELQTRAWLSHALCAPGQHTAKRRRKCTSQSRSCAAKSSGEVSRCDFGHFGHRSSTPVVALTGKIFIMTLDVNEPLTSYKRNA